MRMKTKIMNLLLAAALCLMCCAACTDAADIPDADAGTTTGAIRFTAVRPAPLATRSVSGNDRWKGDGTEKIGVQLLGKGFLLEGIYTITAPDGTADALAGDKPVFWPGKQESWKIAACYPLPGTYDISDQSTPEKFRQADILITALAPFTYAGSTPVSLQFRHGMAKVRVELTGADDAGGEIKVEIRSFKKIGFNLGQIDCDPEEAYITACRDTGDPATVAFEAMLVGNLFTKQDFIRITIGGKTYRFTPGADTPDSFTSGHVYTYHVTIPSSTNP